MNPRKRTPEEVFAAIEEQGHDDEAERILALGDQDLDRELHQAGFDPAAVRARGRAIGEEMKTRAAAPEVAPVASATPAAPAVPAADAKVVPLRARRWIVPAAVAVASAAASVALILSDQPDHPTTPETSGPPGPAAGQVPPPASAAELRAQARAACDRQAWAECLAKLDAARAVDPAGDGDLWVQTARATAKQALGPRP
jgi:hypothetical protein